MIAYLILAHHQPAALANLVRAIDSPDCGIFVHVDRKSDIAPFRQADLPGARFVEPRVNVYWGGWSQIEATVSVIRAALADGRPFTHFVLLSGVDYPTVTTATLAKMLQSSKAEFISCTPLPSNIYRAKVHQLGIRRYEGGYRSQGIRAQFIKLLNKALLLLPVRDVSRTMQHYRFHRGTQWWILSRAMIDTCMQVYETDKSLIRLFKTSYCPDESFFQTIVTHCRDQQHIAHALTYTDWSVENPPAVITDRHIDLLEADAFYMHDPFGSAPCCFVRKFPPDRPDLRARVDAIARARTLDLAAFPAINTVLAPQ